MQKISLEKNFDFGGDRGIKKFNFRKEVLAEVKLFLSLNNQGSISTEHQTFGSNYASQSLNNQGSILTLRLSSTITFVSLNPLENRVQFQRQPSVLSHATCLNPLENRVQFQPLAFY